MKSVATVTSIVLAVLASFVGFCAAHYRRKASKIDIMPDWDIGKIQSIQPPPPPIGIEMNYLNSWRTATAEAFRKSSDLNKTAAELTALSVFFAGVSSIIGALTNFL